MFEVFGLTSDSFQGPWASIIALVACLQGQTSSSTEEEKERLAAATLATRLTKVVAPIHDSDDGESRGAR